MLADLSGATSSGRVKRESAGYGSLLGEPPIEVPGLPAGDISRQQLGIDNPAGMTGEMSPLSIGGMLKLAGKGLLSGGKAALGALGDGGGLLAHTLFHGTPNKWIGNRPSLDFMGTGEGAQAKGWGLYFAEQKGVAKTYRNALSDGTPVIGADISNDAKNAIVDYWRRGDLGEVDLSDDEMAEWLQNVGEDVFHGLNDFTEEGTAAASRLADEIMSVKPSQVTRSPGHLYEVEIPDEITDRMLDWDAPLSEQPESVQQILNNALDETLGPAGESRLRFTRNRAGEDIRQSVYDLRNNDATGEQIYDYLASHHGGQADIIMDSNAANMRQGPKAASNRLSELGIPGIRYFDGDSRAAGEGTRNIVVFNPDDITSVKMDGELVWENRSGIRPD
jgi:hypothetical protein